MPDNDITPPTPVPAVEPSWAPVQSRRGRRTLVLPAAAAALALAIGGTSLGYAVARAQDHTGTTTTTTPQGSSNAALTPGYGQDPGVLQLPTAPYGYDGGTTGGSSTDTTGQAADSQLTGLVRIVSTMKYDGAEAAGTDMVLTSDGEVVTNHHVVEGATAV